MAFKLPLSKNKKEAAAQGADAHDDAAVDTTTPVDPKAVREARANVNPNATYIGDVLQKSGEIRLPLIGKLPLQQQVRILLISCWVARWFWVRYSCG